MLTLTVTDFDQKNIDMIRYTSIICCVGHCKVSIEAEKIDICIDTELCQLDEISQAHDTARRLQKYGCVRMEREYPQVQ